MIDIVPPVGTLPPPEDEEVEEVDPEEEDVEEVEDVDPEEEDVEEVEDVDPEEEEVEDVDPEEEDVEEVEEVDPEEEEVVLVEAKLFESDFEVQALKKAPIAIVLRIIEKFKPKILLGKQFLLITSFLPILSLTIG